MVIVTTSSWYLVFQILCLSRHFLHMLTYRPWAWRDLCPYLWFLFTYIRLFDCKPSLSSLTLWVPWFACFWQTIMDLVQHWLNLMEMHRCGCSLTVWFPLSVFSVFFFFFSYSPAYVCPLLFFFYLSHSFVSSPFCVHSYFLFFFCMLLLSLAWNGDWKPPKVWRNCKSQKQPAQQPCKSTRNFLWKGHERRWKKKAVAELVGSIFYCSV